MVIDFMRQEKLAPLWTVLRVWLGYQWLQAGLHKVSDPAWMQGGAALKGFWGKAIGPTSGVKYGWYKSFLQSLMDAGAYTWFAKLIVFGEILVGIALILGAVTVVALLLSAFMNINFMLAGSASTNPVLYTVAIILLIAGPAAYRYGVDYFIRHGRDRYRGPIQET
ncbi:DoxX family membrane protein [Desulfotomaculum defluvii]